MSEGLRIIDAMDQSTGQPCFLIAWENSNGDRTVMDQAAVDGSPKFRLWPHSLWGRFLTVSDAEKAIVAAGLTDRLLPALQEASA